jgi:hypothetical protein
MRTAILFVLSFFWGAITSIFISDTATSILVVIVGIVALNALLNPLPR